MLFGACRFSAELNGEEDVQKEATVEGRRVVSVLAQQAQHDTAVNVINHVSRKIQQPSTNA